jgi:hypothetical protein
MPDVRQIPRWKKGSVCPQGAHTLLSALAIRRAGRECYAPVEPMKQAMTTAREDGRG